MNDILYIVMPAYNEEANIEAVVAQWYPVVEQLNNGSRLFIVNDGSKDRTGEILTSLSEKYPLLTAATKPNSGHGATLLYAYNQAIAAHADYIFQTDSDGQTNPDEFWTFWEHRDQYDFQTGSRHSRQDGLNRILITKVLRFVVWMMFRVWVKDANTPFRLMKTERLIPILKVIPDNFFLSNVVISTIAVKWGERCAWHPITFKARQGGVNSIHFRRIVKIGIQAIGDFRRLNRNLKQSKQR